MHGSKRRGLETERTHSATAPAPDPTAPSVPCVIEDERGLDDGADPAGTDRHVLQGSPALLELGRGTLAQGPDATQETVVGAGVRR